MSNPFKTAPVAMFEGLKSIVLSTISLLQAFNVINLSNTQQAVVIGQYVAVSAFATLYVNTITTPTREVAMTHRQADALNGSQVSGS